MQAILDFTTYVLIITVYVGLITIIQNKHCLFEFRESVNTTYLLE